METGFMYGLYSCAILAPRVGFARSFDEIDMNELEAGRLSRVLIFQNSELERSQLII